MRDHKLIRIYTDSPFSQDGLITLGKEQSHYLTTVMRRKVDDELLLFNGVDGEFLGRITAATKNEVAIRLSKRTREQSACPDIALLYSPVKNAKSEFVVQKATEMGAMHIQPVITRHTVKDKTNTEKLSLVAIEAAEQCERLDIPTIYDIAKLDDALSHFSGYQIILCDETGKGEPAATILSKLPKGKRYAVLIGPEGGFSDLEISLLHARANIHPIGLGSRILRAETAVMAALALVQNYLGDFDILPTFRG